MSKERRANTLTSQQTVARKAASITKEHALRIPPASRSLKVGLITLVPATSEAHFGYRALEVFIKETTTSMSSAGIILDSLTLEKEPDAQFPTARGISSPDSAPHPGRSRKDLRSLQQNCPRNSGTHVRMHQPATTYHRASARC